MVFQRGFLESVFIEPETSIH